MGEHSAENHAGRYATSWAHKHAVDNPGHRAHEGLDDPGSCDDCRERSPIYDLAAHVIPPASSAQPDEDGGAE